MLAEVIQMNVDEHRIEDNIIEDNSFLDKTVQKLGLKPSRVLTCQQAQQQQQDGCCCC